MKAVYAYRVSAVLALLILGGIEWRNCRSLEQLQDQQKNLLKPAGNP